MRNDAQEVTGCDVRILARLREVQSGHGNANVTLR